MATLDKILPFTKYLLSKCILPGDVVVDGTCGNGNDTLYLAELVGEDGRVVAFDIQQDAINSTKKKLEEAQIDNVDLILDGHENVLNYISLEISAAIFNLGYLPGSDKTVTTNSATTWKAVMDMLSLLKIGGIIILVIYHGHEAGKVERDEIEEKIKSLCPGSTAVLKYEFLNRENAPYVVAIERVR